MNIRSYLVGVPLLRIALALIAGIMIGEAMACKIGPWPWTIAAMATTAVAIAVDVSKHKKFSSLWSESEGGLMLLAVALLGAALTCYDLRKNGPIAEPPIETTTGRKVETRWEGIVCSQPTKRGKTLAADILITTIAGRQLDRPLKTKAHIYQRPEGQDQSVEIIVGIGQGISAQSALEPPHPYHGRPNGNRFDYMRYLQSHGFRAQTFIMPWKVKSQKVSNGPLSRIQRIRLKALVLRSRIVDSLLHLHLAERDHAVLAAMTLGDKSGLTAEIRDTYSVTGASHVLALSGLHLGIIYSLLSLLAVSRHGSSRWAFQFLTLLTIWTFTFVAGLPISLVRSAIMLSMLSIGQLLYRPATSLNSLSLAAILILIGSPSAVWDVGFQLSVMAVAAILIYVPLAKRVWMPRHWAPRWLYMLLAVSLAAQIGTAPLVAYYFGRTAVYFLLTNLIVTPAATAILWLTIATLITSPLPFLAQHLGWLATAIASVMNHLLSAIASWPGASIDTAGMSLVQLLLVYVVITSATVIAAYWVKAIEQKREGRILSEILRDNLK